MCMCVYIYKYLSQHAQLTVFKFQTRTADLHNFIMWLFEHLISLKVHWALLCSPPCHCGSCGQSSLTSRFLVFLHNRLSKRERLSCVSVNVCAGCTCCKVSILRACPSQMGWAFGPSSEYAWVQTSLFRWAASSHFKAMEWRF